MSGPTAVGSSADAPAARLPLSSPAGRWLIATTVLGSGIAFLDSTVVNVALPTIRRQLGGGLNVQQWIVDGYLLTLSALLLLGGALGDRHGRRRVFVVGLIAFGAASLACGLAPSGPALITARAVQGVGGALLVPNSLAMIEALIDGPDRGRAIGVWAGLAGVASAVGPFVGGWLVQAVSWRLVFFINLPLAAVAAAIAVRHVPESRVRSTPGRPDWLGSVLITAGLSGLVFALIEAPAQGAAPPTVLAGVIGAICLVAFPFVEARRSAPLLPPAIFRSRPFTGANVTTLAVYAALSGAMFLLALQLQQSLGYSPVSAGLAMLPTTVIMLVLSPVTGGLADRIGSRLPMTLGPLVAAIGLALMARITPGAEYVPAVLPAVAIFGLGLAITVAPLTRTVLAAVPERQVGIASGTNNTVARLAGLLAVAILPAAAGVETGGGPLGSGFGRAMLIAAVLCVVGGAVAAATVQPSRGT